MLVELTTAFRMAAAQMMDSAILKKTQDVLGHFISKSLLTDALLSKPTFIFLHDVITSVYYQNIIYFEFVISVVKITAKL